MKKIIFAAFFAVALIGSNYAYAQDGMCKENVLDKAWDWSQTLGKSGLDRESVLMKNKAERAQRCAEKLAKKAQAEAGKAADDMKKKLGL
jgi:hypothetical protein